MVTANVNADSWYFNQDSGGNNYGNGQGPRMIVGHTNVGTLIGKNRFAIRIPRGTLFNGITDPSQITAFKVRLKVKGAGACTDNGATVAFRLKRATTAMAENTLTDDCAVGGSGGTSDKRWPGPTTTNTNAAHWSGSPAPGDLITIDALALGREWFSNPTWSTLTLVGVASTTDFSADDETTTARRCSFFTSQSTSVPFVELTASTTNRAPNKPTVTLVADSVSADGTSFTVTAKYTDPDADTSPKYEVRFTPDQT